MSSKKSKSNPLIGLLVGTPLNDGAAVVVDATKKTGKTYKEYLPEIGKQINPKAYIEKKGQ